MPDPSLILPETALPATWVPVSVQRTRSVTALSGHIHTRLQGAQLWRFRLSYPKVTPADFAPVMAFLAERGGRDGIFYVRVPPLAGADPHGVGQFVNLVGSARLHMVTATNPYAVTPTPVGTGDLSFEPTPYLRCSLTTDVQTFESDVRGLYRYDLSLTERLV